MLSIDHEKEDIGARDGDFRRFLGRFRKIGIGIGPDAAGIDDLKGLLAEFALGCDTVSGDSWLIVDNRNPPSCETVKES